MTEALIHREEQRQERLQVTTFPECPSEVYSGYFTDNTTHSKPPLALQSTAGCVLWDFHHSTLSKQIFGAALGMATQKMPVLKNLTKIMLNFLGENGIEYISLFSSPCSEVHPTPCQRGQMHCSLAQQFSVVLSHYFWLRIVLCVQIKWGKLWRELP